MIAVTCPHCRTQFEASPVAGPLACPACRQGITLMLASAMPAQMPRCSRVVYILLAFFLGGLGIHNFVAGYTVRGVVQLVLSLVCAVMVFCTFGLSAIGLLGVFVWTIVEIVVVDKDVNGVKMN